MRMQVTESRAVAVTVNSVHAMTDSTSDSRHLSFSKLTRKQKRFVREKALEILKPQDRVMILLPTLLGLAGAVAGYFLGGVVGHFAFKNHPLRCNMTAAAVLAVIGGAIGWWLLEKHCHPYYRRVLRECEAEIRQIS
jgi:acyl-coenzyme A synthetase/AMP-(fatty) acid ligase